MRIVDEGGEVLCEFRLQVCEAPAYLSPASGELCAKVRSVPEPIKVSNSEIS